MPGLFDAPKPPPVVPPPPPKRDPPVEVVVFEPKAGLLAPEPKSPPLPEAEPNAVVLVLVVFPPPNPPKPPLVPVFVLEDPKRPPPVPVDEAPKAGLLPKPELCCVFEPKPGVC